MPLLLHGLLPSDSALASGAWLLAGPAASHIITTSSLKPILGDTLADVWGPGGAGNMSLLIMQGPVGQKFALYFHIMIFIIFALSL